MAPHMYNVIPIKMKIYQITVSPAKSRRSTVRYNRAIVW